MNKSIKITILIFAITYVSFAQVGIGTTTPDASSALDITATDKGFLMPRMTTVQRTAIASPAVGLQVFDTETKSVWTNDGTVWKEGVGGAGKFVDGATPDIAYYEGKVLIGINIPGPHKLNVESRKSTDDHNRGISANAIFEGTGTSGSTYGVTSSVSNESTGTIAFAIGTRSTIENGANGTITIADGSRSEINNFGIVGETFGSGVKITNSGTMTTSVANSLRIQNDVGKSIADAYSIYSIIKNDGTITDAFGEYIDYGGTGTTTNSYGLFISGNFNKGTNNNYAIYSNSDADSYLKGNLGIGVEDPLQKVHISGAMRLEPLAAAPTGSLGDLYVNTDGKLYFHNGTIWKEVQLVP